MDVRDGLIYSGWIAFLLASTCIYPVTSEEGCLSPLGMEDGRIKDSQIRATSFLNGLSTPVYGRLNHDNGQGGWCPNQTGYGNRTGPLYTQYIQVNLDAPVRIKGIVLQGRAGGKEKVDQYLINYTPNNKDYLSWKWIYDGQRGKVKNFKGNVDSKLQKSILRPPIAANGIRLMPEFMVQTQVCLRLELLGCSFKSGLVMYNMLQGNARGGIYNFTDSIYDGLNENNFLSSGLGFLTDGKLAPADYVEGSGFGWIGWHAKYTPSPYVIFEFLDTRIFSSMTIHCNVRDRTNIKLFSKVEVSFSVDDVAFNVSLTHEPKDVSSGTSGWINYNVTIDLCQHIGKALKLNFTYTGEWILISEVTFKSELLGSKPAPKVYCAPVVIPPLSTIAPSNKGTLLTTTSPSESEGKDGKGGGSGTESDSMDGGVIAGIICAVVAVLLAVVLFICCWRYPHWFFQREKPFNSFIKVEMQPYNHYQVPHQRVSRVNSTASECEENKCSFWNGAHNGGGGGGGADVTACPLYASIGDNINKETTANGQLNNSTRKSLRRHGSDLKPLKKVKPPIPPPLKPVHSLPEVVYAEPHTPLLSPSTLSPLPSPKPPIPPRDSQIDFKGDFPDNDYAEPDTPVVKSPMMEFPAKPNVIGGYAEPIDAISPTKVTTFPNPIYEEVYSEPYQGVSGTSLYCNPEEDLNMRPRQDSFKDFPRHKLHFREKIGDGQFGEVHIGEAEGLAEILGEDFKNMLRVTVAIKTLKPEVDKNIKNDFFKEVKAMAALRHMNVIRLLGVCHDDPMCMIVEYMANGDLNQFLKERELQPSLSVDQSEGGEAAGKFVSPQALFYMAKQVAAGMKYISSLNFVHRDLATRNCLVGHAYTVKIADFGMSRNLYCKHYYRIEGRVILPIRWMAPESILQGRFTTAGDVWAFGVTLWEILTLAREYPYADITDEEVIQNIQTSFRSDTPFTVLPQPGTCPDDLYELMSCCWSKEPGDRPSFAELHSNLAERVRLSEANV